MSDTVSFQSQKSPTPIGERQDWLDLVRGACLISVVILHATSALLEQALIATNPLIESINGLSAPFRMSILMFLSGMLLGKSLHRPAKGFLAGKFNLIFWPYLIWSLVALAAEERLTPIWIAKIPISAPTFLWYLWFICAYYVLSLIIKRLSLPVLAVAAVSLLIAPFLPDFLRMSRFAHLFSFFLIGHYVASAHLIELGRVKAPIALLGSVAALAGAVLAASGVTEDHKGLNSFAPLGLILLLIWWSPSFHSSSLTQPIEWIGRHAIVFYVAHYPAQCIAVKLMSPPVLASYWPAYFALIFVGFAAGPS